MTRPGVNISSRGAPVTRGLAFRTGTWFVAGLAARGPSSEARLVRNMSEFEMIYGARDSGSVLWDALDVAFKEGIGQAYVSRIVHTATATKASVVLNDSTPAAALTVTSVGEGPVPGLTVQVVAGSQTGSYVLVLALDGVEVERSPDLLDNAAAVNWASGSNYVRVAATGANDPVVVGATAVAGGNEQRVSVDDADRIAALARFTKAQGPGQVSIPGATTNAVWAALGAHASANNRVALLDGADTANNATLSSSADTLRATSGVDESYCALFAPWVLAPGLVPQTLRTVPPSALAAGLIARTDAETGNVNQPAAGPRGEARYVVGLAQPEWSDPVRETLNNEGVNVIRMVYGFPRLYGFRSLADPAVDRTWTAFSHGRLRMAISADADVLGEQFMFAQVDGRGRKLAEFRGALIGMLLGYWNRDALYGSTADEAFSVDVGPSVNTPTTLADNQLRAVLSVRPSPFGESVQIEIVSVPTTQTV